MKPHPGHSRLPPQVRQPPVNAIPADIIKMSTISFSGATINNYGTVVGAGGGARWSGGMSNREKKRLLRKAKHL
ncbi:hypothetical protein FVEN_g12770 [Fusarium venenatum]|nr:hypothetical protein FVEN_g12770 [Fusarium venenatum]